MSRQFGLAQFEGWQKGGGEETVGPMYKVRGTRYLDVFAAVICLLQDANDGTIQGETPRVARSLPTCMTFFPRPAHWRRRLPAAALARRGLVEMEVSDTQDQVVPAVGT